MNPIYPLRVLIVCHHNSARGIIAEYLLRQKGKGRFEVHSAGLNPEGSVHPLALWVLQDRFGIDASAARSKSWNEFKNTRFDCVISVCDKESEVCPVWPGIPTLAHWGCVDPSIVAGSEEQKKRAFLNVACQLAAQVDLLCALPPHRLGELNPDTVENVGAPVVPASFGEQQFAS
jgi:arsenate reductase